MTHPDQHPTPPAERVPVTDADGLAVAVLLQAEPAVEHVCKRDDGTYIGTTPAPAARYDRDATPDDEAPRVDTDHVSCELCGLSGRVDDSVWVPA